MKKLLLLLFSILLSANSYANVTYLKGANLGEALGKIFSSFSQSNIQKKSTSSKISSQNRKKCKLGYFSNMTSNICEKLPSNNSYSLVSGGWRCKVGFERVGNNMCVSDTSSSSKIPNTNSSKKLPDNSKFSKNRFGFKCNNGFERLGNTMCVSKNSNSSSSKRLPDNSKFAQNFYGFECNYGFERKGYFMCVDKNSNSSSSKKLPDNSKFSKNRHGFKCNSGFKREGNTMCIKK